MSLSVLSPAQVEAVNTASKLLEQIAEVSISINIHLQEAGLVPLLVRVAGSTYPGARVHDAIRLNTDLKKLLRHHEYVEEQLKARALIAASARPVRAGGVS